MVPQASFASDGSLLARYGESFPISAEVLDSNFCLAIGKAKVERDGKDVMITTFSRMMGYAIKITEILDKEWISAKSGKAFTAKGMQVLELVGKETMDLLIIKTGIEVDKKRAQTQDDEDQLFEEVTFDRCFYIYVGPKQLGDHLLYLLG
ncbi:hypothetical protein LOK49_LG03G01362 [Camellia lanceoleosa]|uniref:Uncharacterized protein n=1 Tax=Camellia lanceoleosa TaxID=1840588 RepID=A0ACC0IEC7_9ERIC|nr:hypothetical protein LOK49_LG03G01362 [Camellia lanceoleosa]